VGRRAWLAALIGWTGCRRPNRGGLPGYALIANQGGKSVAAIHLDTLSVRRHVSLADSPSAVVTHPARDAGYVLTPHSGTIYELAIPGLSVIRRHRLAGSLHSVRMASDGKTLWALARDDRRLVEWNLESWRLGRRILLPEAPEDFDLSREGVAAVAFPEAGLLGYWNLDSGKRLHLAEAGGTPRVVRFRSDGRQVLAGLTGQKTLLIADVESGRTVTRLPLVIEPEQFCFKADGGILYVTGAGRDAVVSVYPYRGVVAETFLAGRAPGAMAVSGGAEPLLFVANPESGDVTVIDVITSKVIAAVAVGQEPACIAVTPDDRYALVLNRRSGDVAVLLLEALRNRRVRPAPPPLFTMIPVGAQPVSAAIKVLV